MGRKQRAEKEKRSRSPIRLKTGKRKIRSPKRSITKRDSGNKRVRPVVKKSGRRKNKDKDKRSRSPKRNSTRKEKRNSRSRSLEKDVNISGVMSLQRKQNINLNKQSSSSSSGNRRAEISSRDVRIHREDSNSGSGNSKRFGLKKTTTSSPNDKKNEKRNRRSLSEDRDYRKSANRKNSVNKNNKNKTRLPFEKSYSLSGPSDEKRKRTNFTTLEKRDRRDGGKNRRKKKEERRFRTKDKRKSPVKQNHINKLTLRPAITFEVTKSTSGSTERSSAVIFATRPGKSTEKQSHRNQNISPSPPPEVLNKKR